MWPFNKKKTNQDIIDKADAFGECMKKVLNMGGHVTLGNGVFEKYTDLEMKAMKARRRIRNNKLKNVTHLKKIN